MRKTVFIATMILMTCIWPFSFALAGYGTSIWDRAGDPYNWSIWGFTGVYGYTNINNPIISQGGFHVSSLYIYGYYHDVPRQEADMAEVGWVKHPSAGISTPQVFAAWRWQNYPPYGSITYPQYNLPIGSSRYFKIQKEWDGSSYSWHGYYNDGVWRQILWVGNRAQTGAPIAAAERYHEGITVGGIYYPGDDEGSEFHWYDLYRRDSRGNWGRYTTAANANWPPLSFYVSTDCERDPWIYDNTHYKSYKARNNPWSFEWDDYNW